MGVDNPRQIIMWLIQIPSNGVEISASNMWLIVGTGLCLLELFVPTAFTAVCMGMSALLVSLVALVIPSSIGWQISIWLAGTCCLVAIGYQVEREHVSSEIQSSTEAEAITAMMPNQTGRVLYEGSSWQAKCADGTESISPHDKLYVLGREGNVLVVMPIHSSEIR
jgi:membrane protein implicated in regulation of membrane protease activity